MTRATTPNTCDFCKKEMNPDEMSYTVQFSQKQPYGKGIKGKIVSSKNRADMCKTDFQELMEGSNYKLEWEAIVKQDDGTWKKEAIEAQQTI